ncbi:hypothetical protein AAE02nite_23820 [Adhaeribacter aerolatus]|uniref:Peptidase E n=1 Tax=Adhaeribacter aerolatus TaxID=670289 RepID=A0A512AYD0_9BACT|nr:DUF6702 family protein [Adhaeribacter aerolatus]GEO04718.1 hypothetical protein AAE02nite_23820 [Adhaeribacter aerolatus]
MLHLFLINLFAFLHPFYVSVTEVNHNDKTKSLEISTRIFFDDLETVLEKQFKTRLDILKPAEKNRIDPLLREYLQKHLQLQINGKPVTLTYLGYEIEQDAAWCYLEVPQVSRIKQIQVLNDVLFAEHDTQTNMVHITVKGNRKSTKLDNPESKFTATF